MTMDGVEVVGSQPHAATSPFLLSSPPLGHHHHHHATFNLPVQLSFDACLPYNAASSSGSVTCGVTGPPPVNATCTNSSSSSCGKSTPQLSLSSSVPLHMQLQISSTAPPSEHNHGRHHQHHLVDQHRLDDHHQHQLVHVNASSPSTDTVDGKRHRQPDDDDKSCIRNCRSDIHDTNDKDKPGDLNTPVTTSSDLPSFFGPSALVEPPPISGTYISELVLKTRESIEGDHPIVFSSIGIYLLRRYDFICSVTHKRGNNTIRAIVRVWPSSGPIGHDLYPS
ncbi:uncharacterized protein LOC112464788 [Temnothorax curvispinosus]|uniref:Uncharacterized protein LOC112464788 n=1 Tax=Temnothorax curvispinosus TaxID=300111 RepID=A0A6J1R4G6_9HYME|nr:uncharacterized protein LOC112464788 [Temnothorax curvispinosus]XP_024887755.1 uncharacterized protein LOC112464788 [Temnothorax curvispinosus]